MGHNTIPARPRQERRPLLIGGIILTAVIALLYLSEPTFFRFLDNRLYDTLLRSTANGDVTEVPVIVDLDEESLAQFGQWPWPRYRVALLLRKLKELGAAGIGLDMVFPEADRTSFVALQRDILQDFKIRADLSGLPAPLRDHDRGLAAVLAQGPFVLGYKFTLSDEEHPRGEPFLHPINVVTVGPTNALQDGDFLFRAHAVVGNLKIFSSAAPASGFFNVAHDFDGILRRAPLLMVYNGKYYPSLALATLMQSLGTDQVTLRLTRAGVDSLHLDRTNIPLDSKGNLLIHYRGKSRTFKYISAGDVLSDRIPREHIRGKLVFVGISAAGLGDVHPSPLDTVFPGVEVHATIADNILRKDFLARPTWAPGLELFLILVFGVLSTLLLSRTGAAWSVLVLGGGALGLWQGAQWVLQTKVIFLSPLIPIIAVGGNIALLTLLKYWQEERKAKARARDIVRTQDFTILCLASLTETRHRETGRHILRTQRYVRCLCRQLASNAKFRATLDPETIEQLYKSAPLHDIGKVGVPDHILLKPGMLTPAEYEEVKKHTTYGRDVIQRAEEKFGTGANISFLRLAKEIAYSHHERWDGTGYPQSLKGESIPLSSRIMALADIYDTVTSPRVYKGPIPHDEAVTLLTDQSGKSLDPDLVDAFLAVQEEFRQIALEYGDHEEKEARVELLPRHEQSCPLPETRRA
jgi:adenylate cyclase